MKIKCQKCGYEWDTSSSMNKVTCPSCGYKTPNPKKTQTVQKRNTANTIKKKDSKEVRTLTNKWKGAVALVVVAAIAIGAWTAFTMPGETDKPTGVDEPSGTNQPAPEAATVTLTQVFAGQGQSYIENVYLVDPAGTADVTTDIDNGTSGVLATFDGPGETRYIDYEQRFKVVAEVYAFENELAYSSVDNMYGTLEWTDGTAAFVSPGTFENTMDSSDDSTAYEVNVTDGDVRANFVFENTETGAGSDWWLLADENAKFNITFYTYR